MDKVMELLGVLSGSRIPSAGANTQDHSGITGLWSAARQGHLALVAYLLEQRGDPDLPAHSGLGPLHAAALQGFTEVAAVLLKHRARADAVDKQGNTPLLWAIQNWNKEAVQLLLDSGAQRLDTARQMAETLRSKEELGDEAIDWMTQVVAAIDVVLAKAPKAEDESLSPEAAKRRDKVVQMACSRALRNQCRCWSNASSWESMPAGMMAAASSGGGGTAMKPRMSFQLGDMDQQISLSSKTSG